MVGERLMTYTDDSWKINNGFFEFIPEDGIYVDLTQPGLLSQGQIIHIFWRRGFASLLSSTGTNKESLIRAYVKYVQPLPCRDEQSITLTSAQKLSDRHQIRCCQSTDVSDHRSHLKLSSNIAKERKNHDLDSLVIINNPNWPTSGVTPVEEKKVPKVESKTKENNKRPVPDPEPPSSSFSQPPLKRPKINRNFDGLEELLGKNKFPA